MSGCFVFKEPASFVFTRSLRRPAANCLLLAGLIVCTSGCLSSRIVWREPNPAAPLAASWHPPMLGLSRNPSQFETEPSLQALQNQYAAALEQEQACQASCVDLYFRVAVATCRADGPMCEDCPLRCLHKSALVRLVVAGQQFGRLDPSRGLEIRRAGRTQWVPLARNGFVWSTPYFHSLKPVGEYRSNSPTRKHCRDGAGIPLVVTGCDQPDETLLAKRPIFAATLCMTRHSHKQISDDIQQQPVEIRLELYDPLRCDRTNSEIASQPIAKDLSAPLVYRLRDAPTDTILTGFINPFATATESRLHTIEPYQPGKIPVIFVHGLLSSAFSWVEMTNELQADPEFVKHYQIWVFEYPTGESFLFSAANLRKQLLYARQRFDPHYQDPQFANMILVGHSMGGLIGKLQITSSGDALWQSVSNRPLQDIVISDQSRAEIRRSFYFEPSSDIRRIIYIGTPHRGSQDATRLIGRIGSALVRESESRVQAHRAMISNNPGVFSREVTRRIPTSIDLLDPNSPMLLTLDRLPVSPGVPSHSIIGNSCRSLLHGPSDGVVPVDSAHEPSATTEITVPDIHTKLNKNLASIDEVRCLLELHYRQSQPLPHR